MGTWVFIAISLVTFQLPAESSEPLVYLGCYSKETTTKAPGANDPDPPTFLSGSTDLWFSPTGPTSTDSVYSCLAACRQNSFRYAGLSSMTTGGDMCSCGSSYGSTGPGQCPPCRKDRPFDQEHCGDEASWSIYDTGFKVPSPPTKVTLVHRGENTLRISWSKPMATNGPLTAYLVTAHGLFTYAHNTHHDLQVKSWRVSDVDEEFQLIGLLPATKYNVTVSAINSEGQSSPTSVIVWTKLSIPDTPPSPTILNSVPKRMTIKLEPFHNSRGPLSKYRIVMVDESRLFQTRIFTMDRVVTWNDSMATGYPKYVAAQFPPEEFPPNGEFVIGDEKMYDGFYNGVIPEGHWHPSLGIVSTLDDLTEISYSPTSHEQHEGDLKVNIPSSATSDSFGRKKLKHKRPLPISDSSEVTVREMSPMVMALWIAIAVTAVILAVCISVYFVLTLDLLPKHRRRPPLLNTLSRPSYERPTELTTCSANPAYLFPDDFSAAYTHSGFVSDEDLKSRALDRLKHIWNVPRNFVSIPSDEEEEVVLIGRGRYGVVHSSHLRAKDTPTPVLLYTIPGNFLKDGGDEEKEKFVQDLTDLVKIDAHVNVVKLIGFMEDGPSLLIVLEFGGKSLKEWLLDFRNSSDSVTKMSPTTSYNLILCAMNIAEAMFHLDSFKITHGELAASNVLVTTVQIPKVTGYGLLKCDPQREGVRRDFSRWFAVEQFQNRCVKPCDTWSFGVLLWEIASLGATPYHDVRSEDLPKRLSRGLRPGQLEVIGDPLYQIMLHCWQLDRDERPDFATLSCSLHQLLSNPTESLCVSPSLKYPPRIQTFEYTN